MNIKESLNEINEYIESKILKGDFEYISNSNSDMSSEFIIDKCKVRLWTYSNCDELKIVQIGEFYPFKKQAEIRKVVKPVIDEHIKKNIIKKKEAELAKLKAELS